MPSSSARLAHSLLYTSPSRCYVQPVTFSVNFPSRQPLLRPPPRAAFSRTAGRGRPSAPNAPLSGGRYGTANEPLPHMGGGKANESKEGERKEADNITKPALETKEIKSKDKRERGGEEGDQKQSCSCSRSVSSCRSQFCIFRIHRHPTAATQPTRDDAVAGALHHLRNSHLVLFTSALSPSNGATPTRRQHGASANRTTALILRRPTTPRTFPIHSPLRHL